MRAYFINPSKPFSYLESKRFKKLGGGGIRNFLQTSFGKSVEHRGAMEGQRPLFHPREYAPDQSWKLYEISSESNIVFECILSYCMSKKSCLFVYEWTRLLGQEVLSISIWMDKTSWTYSTCSLSSIFISSVSRVWTISLASNTVLYTDSISFLNIYSITWCLRYYRKSIV